MAGHAVAHAHHHVARLEVEGGGQERTGLVVTVTAARYGQCAQEEGENPSYITIQTYYILHICGGVNEKLPYG